MGEEVSVSAPGDTSSGVITWGPVEKEFIWLKEEKQNKIESFSIIRIQTAIIPNLCLNAWQFFVVE